MEEQLGSLEVGKKADVIIFDMSALGLTPNSNPVSNIVYAGSGNYVDTNIVNGRILMRNKQLLTLDVEDVKRKALAHSAKLLERSGVKIEPKWPIR
jgi:cytosine/adenosine deaminase-related metal-dependent hydrolase